MPKKQAASLEAKPALKRGHSKVLIGGAVALVLALILLIIVSMRPNEAPQSNSAASNTSSTATDGRARQVSYEVVSSYPHDSASFTQGFLWYDGTFYESTGQYGQSKLRRLEFPSGRVIKEIKLAPELFGEGLALVDSRLMQLTWTAHRGFVYNLDTFQLMREFAYETEGWGLTYDGTNLILSDGSSDLFFLDPTTFKPVRKLAVTMNNQPIRELNELEFIDGEIWSNVWQTDLIVRIDPVSGRVTSFLNLKGILAPSDKTGSEDVLNGIAYDAEHKRLFVTGKLWPRIFEIRVR